MGAVDSGKVKIRSNSLSPAFRLAVLTGAFESVRIHLNSGNDVNATDESGRSSLMLAASRGHREICMLLLEAGADSTLKDNLGNDAVALALLRGQTEIAELLQSVSIVPSRHEEGEANASGHLAGDTRKSTNEPDRVVAVAVCVGGTTHTNEIVGKQNHLDARAGESSALGQPLLEKDDEFDLSGWQEEVEGAIPPDDQSCADDTSVLQDLISHHVPIDTDEAWEDVDISLPEIYEFKHRRLQITFDKRQALRELFIEALRDGCIGIDRIFNYLPELDWSDSINRDEIEANLHHVLCELGVLIEGDNSWMKPHRDIGADEEEQFGDIATEAVNYFTWFQSINIDNYELYYRQLSLKRLSREDESELGIVIKEGLKEVFAAIAGSPAVVSSLRSDLQAVSMGEISDQLMFRSAVDHESNRESQADGKTEDEIKQLISVVTDLVECPSSIENIDGPYNKHNVDNIELAANLFNIGLTPAYFSELQYIASHDPDFKDAKQRINAGHEKIEDAKKCLIEANLKFVIMVARKYFGKIDFDLIQEGNIGLIRAAERFNHKHGIKFISYAVFWIKQAIFQSTADTARTIRVPTNIHAILRKVERAHLQVYDANGVEPDVDEVATVAGLQSDQVRKLLSIPREQVPIDLEMAGDIYYEMGEWAPSPEDILISLDKPAIVREHLNILLPRERDVVCMKFGIDTDEHTLEEIGDKFGLTRERMRQILEKALRKLSSQDSVRQLRNSLN